MSTIVVPFKDGDTIIELGGGDKPTLKGLLGLKIINVDIRQLPGVDIVRNLEEDFSDIGMFDGVFASYLLEHISWRKVAHFLEQCYKILKPNSYALFVVPDTYAQMQKILEKPPEKINLDDSSFLFGGQEFSDNTHKWLISRPLLHSMLTHTGFSEVEITSLASPDARDIIVKAYKGEQIGEQTNPDSVKLNLMGRQKPPT